MFDPLATSGPVTSAELAGRIGLDEVCPRVAEALTTARVPSTNPKVSDTYSP